MSFRQTARLPRLLVVLPLLFAGPASAATLQYVSTSETQQMEAFLGYNGRAITHYTEINGGGTSIDLVRYHDEQIFAPGVSETGAFSANVSGSYDQVTSGDTYGYANADFSALTATGFSMSGSVATVGVASYTDQYSEVERTFNILLTETTQLQITASWSNLVDIGGGGSGMNLVIADDIFCSASATCVNDYDVGFSTFSSGIAAVSGSDSQIITLGPGVYVVGLGMTTAESGSFAKQQSFDGSFSVSVVPVPAAVWLFGSALAALGFVRRRISSVV